MYCNSDFVTEQANGITITAYNELLEERAADNAFCWGYYLRIENNSKNKISLLGRKISVTDVTGQTVSVASEGFGGELPEIAPGEFFEFEDYATSKASAVLCGSCRIDDGTHQIRNIAMPVMSLIADGNEQRILN